MILTVLTIKPTPQTFASHDISVCTCKISRVYLVVTLSSAAASSWERAHDGRPRGPGRGCRSHNRGRIGCVFGTSGRARTGHYYDRHILSSTFF